MGTLVVLWSLLAVSLGSEFDYTVEVPAGRQNCYYQPITDVKHATIELDYQVIDGGDLDINFYARNPSGVVLSSDTRKMENTHRFSVNGLLGDYELCFDNSFSYQQEKTVFFEILLLDKDGNYDDLEDLDRLATDKADETLDHVKGSSARLKGALNRAEHFQSLVRAAEARDRAVMEANFSRVNTWSIIHLLVMLAVATSQIYLIRTLFDDHSKVGKILREGKID